MESHSFPEEDWQVDLDLSSRGRYWLKSGLWADVEFSVGETENSVKAHRLVLASASKVFADMLYGPSAEEKSPIRIPDVTPEIFNLLLEFIYSDNIEEISVEKIPELENVNRKFRVPHLMKPCAKTLTKNVTSKNAIQCYEFATVVEYQPLINACAKVFSVYPILVLESESALNARIDTLEFFFSQDYISISSELDLLPVVEKYAKRNEDKKNEDETRFIRSLLQKIRFLAEDLSEMVKQHQRLRAFLSEGELLSLMMNHVCEDVVPMPEGFTKNRNRRILTIPLLREINGDVVVGRVFQFVGLVNEDAGRFNINLNEAEDRMGRDRTRTTFHLSVRFDDPHEGHVVVRNTYQNRWLEEEREGGMPFATGQPFEVTIEIESNRFKVSVNGSFFCGYNHRLPFGRIKYLEVEGDCELYYFADS